MTKKQLQPPGQQRPYPPPTSAGKIPFSYSPTNLHGSTAYWVWGDLSTTTTQKPLICLHGGPGVPHNYLLPLSLLWRDHAIPIIMYDQIGCGASTRFPTHRGDAAFWTPQLFMAELDNLRHRLGIAEFDLLGQSWGGMLAGQYAIERQPRGLRKLVIADSPSDMRTWVRVADELRGRLPRDVRDTLERCEREGRTGSAEYEAAVRVFYGRHVCRLDPWPRELELSFAALREDDTVYSTMNGPSEFRVVGTLKSWSLSGQLGKITSDTAPGGVLVVNGYYDEAQDECVEPWVEMIGARTTWFRYALSSHMPMLEETERFVRDLGRFLTRRKEDGGD
jgi:L-proline amide hydrolase